MYYYNIICTTTTTTNNNNNKNTTTGITILCYYKKSSLPFFLFQKIFPFLLSFSFPFFIAPNADRTHDLKMCDILAKTNFSLTLSQLSYCGNYTFVCKKPIIQLRQLTLKSQIQYEFNFEFLVKYKIYNIR